MANGLSGKIGFEVALGDVGAHFSAHRPERDTTVFLSADGIWRLCHTSCPIP